MVRESGGAGGGDQCRGGSAEMAEKMLNDPTCKRALDPSVMGFELEAALKLMTALVETEKANLHHA